MISFLFNDIVNFSVQIWPRFCLWQVKFYLVSVWPVDIILWVSPSFWFKKVFQAHMVICLCPFWFQSFLLGILIPFVFQKYLDSQFWALSILIVLGIRSFHETQLSSMCSIWASLVTQWWRTHLPIHRRWKFDSWVRKISWRTTW